VVVETVVVIVAEIVAEIATMIAVVIAGLPEMGTNPVAEQPEEDN
jgi:hypothetical protein